MNNQNNKTAYANHNIEKRFLETAETFHGTFQSFRPFPKASMQTSYGQTNGKKRQQKADQLWFHHIPAIHFLQISVCFFAVRHCKIITAHNHKYRHCHVDQHRKKRRCLILPSIVRNDYHNDTDCLEIIQKFDSLFLSLLHF